MQKLKIRRADWFQDQASDWTGGKLKFPMRSASAILESFAALVDSFYVLSVFDNVKEFSDCEANMFEVSDVFFFTL